MVRQMRLPVCFLALLALLYAGTQADEKVLYEKDSQYNTILVTEDDQGLRTLYFEENGARQSVVKVTDPDHLELKYARAMPVGLAFVEKPQRMLIVGLGGGTIPSFLHKHYPRTKIDVVDIDPDVVDVAKKFFGFREDASMHVHVEDGRRFIEECPVRYDIIFLDAYGPEQIPYHLATREFLLAVRRALTPEGIAVANVWSGRSNRYYRPMIRTYQSVFDELYIVDVRGTGNKIVLALPRKQWITRGDLARRASAISKEKHFRFDMGDIVTNGYQYAGKMNSRGRILMDKKRG